MDLSHYRLVALDMYRLLHRSLRAHVSNTHARTYLQQRAKQQFRIQGARVTNAHEAELLLRRAQAVLLASLPPEDNITTNDDDIEGSKRD
jgi:hypothetical protein